MAKRYALAPIIGDGSSTINPFRSKITDIPDTAVSAIIPTDSQGRPLWAFCLCVFNTPTLLQVQQLANVYVFPDYPLDGQMGSMEGNAAAELEQNVEAYDMDGEGQHFDVTFASTDSFRQVLQAIGEQFDPAFNLSALDVRD